MKELLPDYKVIYLARTEKRLITAMYELTCEGFIYATYANEIDKNHNQLESSKKVWRQLTRNAYYDAAIRNWCMLFGSRNEPTHYSKLLTSEIFKSHLIQLNIGSTVDELRTKLLMDADLTREMHSQYHQATKKYRDMYLIHREHSPNIINDGDLNFPILDSAIRLFYSLFGILVKLADTFESKPITKYDFKYISYTKRHNSKTN
jgi:hypothetical protein